MGLKPYPLLVAAAILALASVGCRSRQREDGRVPIQLTLDDRAARSVEADTMIGVIVGDAIRYYRASDPPQRFPESAPRTPREVPCGPVETPPEAWSHPTWQLFGFHEGGMYIVEEPHYYSYQFDSSGSGTAATFTASAFGDLDCDGNQATFMWRGRVRPDGTPEGEWERINRYE
jgi:hypothetical protein